jgi:hypothetical protein
MNIRTLTLSAVLVVILMLTVQWVTARTEIASDHSSNPASALNNQEQSANQNKASISSYRSRLDECFDVPLSEIAACHTESQSLVPSYRSRLDECFDVSLSEVASCRNESQASIP